jgi:DNA (cytosine-5)-methyltransferase 1
MRWANDIWDKALHTYMANASQNTKGILGSVDDLLQRVLEGKYQGGLPRPGEVDCISGGSPCQGFSLITNDKTSDRQKKNRSLVASFASFVDFYRPKYGILENVPHIVQTGKGRDEDAFSQLICAIVGLGYQVQVMLGDAWAHGAPQSRSRAFLVFAAPGFELPEPPRPSHSHAPGVRTRGLGRLTSGDPFVNRSMAPTPFRFVCAAEATSDLPPIYDGKADCSVAFPDHRISIGVTQKARSQFNRIPIHPHGMSFASAWNEGKGVMTPSERTLFPKVGLRVTWKKSKGWGRVKPDGLFHTITTCCQPTDTRVGRALHWHEDRPITVLEARRAQGFLDHEVLAGPPVDQYHLVGNSVARPMALALGLQFRKACLGTLYDEAFVTIPEKEVHTRPPVVAKKEDEEVRAEEGHDVEEAVLKDVIDSDAEDCGRLGVQVATPPSSTLDVHTSHWDRKRPLTQALEGPGLVDPKRLRLQQDGDVDFTDTGSEPDMGRGTSGTVDVASDITSYAVHPPTALIRGRRSMPTVVKLSPAPFIDLSGDD